MTDRLWNWDEPLQRCPEMGESRAANQGLHDYALMGPRRSLRSLLDEYIQLFNEDSTKRPPTLKWNTLAAWSLRYAWVARANRNDKLEQDRAAEEWRERQSEIRQQGWDIGQSLLKRAEKMLKYPLEEAFVKKEVEDKDGKIIEQHITILPAGWSQATANSMAKMGADLCRLSAEMETDRTKVDIDWRDKFKEAGVDPQEIFNALVEAKAERLRRENEGRN